jgi:hypothetical protein
MAFYKKTSDNTFIEAQTFVMSTNYILLADDKDTDKYSVDDWHWFDIIDEMYTSFAIQNPITDNLIFVKNQLYEAINRIIVLEQENIMLKSL